LIDSVLVDNLNILFNLKNFELSPKGISIDLFQTYNQSTYDSKLLEISRDQEEDVFTRLIYVKDIFIDTKKERIGDHLAQIDVNTF